MTSSKASAGLSRWLRARRFLDRVDERLELFLRLLEFVVQLDDLVERGGLLLWLPGLVEKASSSSARETGAERSSIGSFFFVGMRKWPSFLSSFLVESHQRLNSGSLKTSPSNQLLICACVALPPRLSRMLRITAAGSPSTRFFSAGRSLAFRARKWSGRESGSGFPPHTATASGGPSFFRSRSGSD